MRWPLGVLLGAGLLAGCASRGSFTPLPAPTGEAVLAPGDSLLVAVWRAPEMSGAFRITEAGTIAHPLYRSIPVAGRPLYEVRMAIEDYLRTLQQNPQVTVEGRLQVAITGEVRLPGLYWVPPEATITLVMARAGGATERADLDRILVQRGNALHIVSLTDPALQPTRLAVRSSDQITVGRSPASPLIIVGLLATVTSLIASIVVITGNF